ncbi:MAG: hypothetical protein M3P93_02745 [Actinomycetota bacterium]|nr:hypothetical protein [Actinomycetota bacterium]
MSSRRRKRAVSTGTNGSAGVPVRPQEWPSSQELQERLDLSAVLSSILDRLSAEDLLAHLQSMPVKVRRPVLRAIGLTAATSVNKGMVNAPALAAAAGGAHKPLARAVRGRQPGAGSAGLRAAGRDLAAPADR